MEEKTSKKLLTFISKTSTFHWQRPELISWKRKRKCLTLTGTTLRYKEVYVGDDYGKIRIWKDFTHLTLLNKNQEPF